MDMSINNSRQANAEIRKHFQMNARTRVRVFVLICAMVLSTVVGTFPAFSMQGDSKHGMGGPGYPLEIMPDTIPNVNFRMMEANYWVSDKDRQETRMTKEEIEALNGEILATPDTHVMSVKDLPSEFDGVHLRDTLALFEDPKDLYLNEQPVPASYYEVIRANIAGASVNSAMRLRYGVAVNRTLMKSLPYDDFLSDGLGDPEWDNLVDSAVLVNEPLGVYFASADGRYYYVQSEICSGWVPSADVALCRDRDELIAATEFEHFIIVTGDHIQLEKSSADPRISGRVFEMGTRLELSSEKNSMIANRMSWYNYPVFLPCRAEDGSYEKAPALVSAGSDVSSSYLRLSSGILVDQAMKCLGNRYGWGGMLDSQDCSSFVRELYLCFGLKLPRNTTWQGAIPVRRIALNDMSDTDKQQLLDTMPPGVILQFRGHEMLYLGSSGGEHFTINDVSSMMLDNEQGESIKYRVRSVIINSLEVTKRTNGKTWLNQLDLIIIPWEK